MRVNRWVGGLVATGATAGALVVGGGTAFADAPPPTTAGATNAKTCTDRIPAILARIDKVTTRINGDPSTKGSTAWLEARETRARAAGDNALADLISARVGNRQARLDELTKAKSTVQGIQQEDCAS